MTPRTTLMLAASLLISCSSETPDGGETGPVEDPNANADGDCMTDAEELALGTDPGNLDTDGDTLTDCDEIALGTNPLAPDSDGDGIADAQELACVSSPTDPKDKCYACGWKHNDPGNLLATGKDDGQVIGNMQLVDQCNEVVSLWDFANTPASPAVESPPRYHILLMTAAW
jgi:hypothetical protein